MMSRQHLIWITTCVLSLPSIGQTPTQDFRVNVNDLVKDSQVVSNKEDFRMIWWIPDEYWIAYSKQNNSNPDPVLKALDKNIIIAVIDGKISQLGSIIYAPEEQTRSYFKINSLSGKEYLPIPEKSITGDIKNLISMIKPLLSNAMGEMGQNFRFYLFPKYESNGSPIVTAKSEGRFRVIINDDSFYIRLPLASLSPKLKCKDDGELFPSNFKYCPFHGSILVQQ